MSEQINEIDKTEEEYLEKKYKPRNKIIAKKEALYDRMKISVRQIDFFIAICVFLVVAIIVISVLR